MELRKALLSVAMFFSALSLPIFQLCFLNSKELGQEYIDSILFTFLLSLAIFPIYFLLLVKPLKDVFLFLLAALLSASVLNTFFLPSTLVTADGTDSIGLMIRQEARISTLVLMAIFLVSYFFREKNLVQKAANQLRFPIIMVCLGGLLLAGYGFIGIPNVKSALMDVFVSSEAEEGFVLGKKNVLVLSFDQVQGSGFKGYLESGRNPQLRENLKGFDFYPNAVVSYPNTVWSLAATVLGRRVKGGEEGIVKALTSQEGLINLAKKSGFETQFVMDVNAYFKDDKYFDHAAAPRLLPIYALNVAFGIDISGVLPDSSYGELGKYKWKLDAGKMLDNFPRTLSYDPSIEKSLNFIHFKFSHQPFSIGNDCSTHTKDALNTSQNVGGFISSMDCISLGLDIIFKRLKELGIYDQTAIFLISDHGFEANLNQAEEIKKSPSFFFKDADYISSGNIKTLGGYNPWFVYKGIGAQHDLSIKEDTVSLIDIAPTACAILDGCEKEWDGVNIMNGIPDRDLSYWFYQSDKPSASGYHEFNAEEWEVVTTSKGLAGLRDTLRAGSVEDLRCGQVVGFQKGSSQFNYLQSGLSAPEPFGRWSDGGRVAFMMSFSSDCNPTQLRMNLAAFVNGIVHEQQASVYVNGDKVSDIHIEVGEKLPRDFILPVSKNDKGDVEIEFRILNPQSPKELGLSNDPRLLGLRFVEMEVLKGGN